MKKQFLLTLPLMAAMLAACGSKGGQGSESGSSSYSSTSITSESQQQSSAGTSSAETSSQETSTKESSAETSGQETSTKESSAETSGQETSTEQPSTSAPLPDPSEAQEVVTDEVAFEKLQRAATKVVTSDKIGVKLGLSEIVDIALDFTVFGDEIKNTGYIKENADFNVEVNGKGLSQTGVQNYKGSGSIKVAGGADVKLPDNLPDLLGLVKAMGGPEINIPEQMMNFNLPVKGNIDAFYDDNRVYLEYDQDLVDTVKRISEFAGEKIDEENFPAAGKYVTPEVPLNDAARAFNLGTFLTPYVEQYIPMIQQYIEQYKGFCKTFEGLKYSETKFAIFAEIDVIDVAKKVLAMNPDTASYAGLVDNMLDANDQVTVKLGLEYDTEKGIENLGISADAKLDLTFGDAMYAVAVMNDPTATRQSVEESIGEQAKVKLVDAKIGAALALELATGDDVQVVELSAAQKAEYQEIAGAQEGKPATEGQDF